MEGKMLRLDTKNGLEILGNMIASNADSPNNKYFGPIWMFARHLLGYSWQPLDQHKLVPSALEHYETTMRDPVYYQILKKLFLKFERFMSLHVTPYTEKDLVFPGVKVTDMEVDPLITYDEYFYSDLSNAVWYHPEEKTDFRVRVRQSRLNHKPFNVKIHINSDKKQKVSMKMYMVPKYDEYDRLINLTENRRNMMEMDHWVTDLKSGENLITRNSHEFTFYADDRMSHTRLYEKVDNAIEKHEPLPMDGRQNYFYWPRRYITFSYIFR